MSGQSHLVVLVECPSQVGRHNLFHPEKFHQPDRKSCVSRSESLIKVSSTLEYETLSPGQPSQQELSLMARDGSEGIVGDLLVIQWGGERFNREA